MGQGRWFSKINGKTMKEYSVWLHMMRRCYSEKFQNENPSYKGVAVCEYWHNFQNFCEDIKFLDGYEKWKDSNDKYHLDKDILCEQKYITPKIYSLETCMFVTQYNNISESTSRKNITGLTYIGISPSGDEYEFTNQSKFAEEYNLNNSLISACINKTRKQHKGWTFKIKEY